MIHMELRRTHLSFGHYSSPFRGHLVFCCHIFVWSLETNQKPLIKQLFAYTVKSQKNIVPGQGLQIGPPGTFSETKKTQTDDTKNPDLNIQGWFQGPPILGPLMVSFPYYSHIFGDAYGSGMGIVWERGPNIGGPWIKFHWNIGNSMGFKALIRGWKIMATLGERTLQVEAKTKGSSQDEPWTPWFRGEEVSSRSWGSPWKLHGGPRWPPATPNVKL